MPDPALLCVHCGYDLRGINDFCPECGLPVVRSRDAGQHLQLANPRWLRRLRDGCVAMLLVAAGLGCLLGPPFFDFSPSDDHTLLYDGSFAWGVLWIVPLLLLTRPESSHRRSAGDRWRWAVQCCAPIGLIAAASFYRLTHGQFSLAAEITLFALIVCISITFALVFLLLQSLARRVLNARLTEHCKIVAIGIVTAVTLVYPASLLRDNQNWTALLLVVPVAMVLVFYVWSILLLFWFVKEFHTAAKTATVAWATVKAVA